MQHTNAVELPVHKSIIFSNHKDVYKKGIEKRQTQLLKKIAYVGKFLQPEEKILLVTTSCSPTSFFDQLITGWLFIYIKRSILVFTDKRIFHIPTRWNFTYRNSIANIKYSDCKSIKMRRSHLVIIYNSGKKETFFYVPGKEKNKLKTLLPSGENSRTDKTLGARTFLCPRCTQALTKDNYRCSQCRLEFKSKKEGRKIALLVPGGGYFYTRHSFLGLADAVAELLLIFIFVSTLLVTITEDKDLVPILIVISILLVLEKSISIYHTNHFINEYIPVDTVIKPMT